MCRWEDITKMDLQEFGVDDGLDCSASRWGQMAGPCECYIELSGSINRGKFL